MNGYLNIDNLIGSGHGVRLPQALLNAEPTDGLHAVTHETSSLTFVWDEDHGEVRLNMPGRDTNLKVSAPGYMKAMRMVGFPEAVCKKFPEEQMLIPLNWAFTETLKEVQMLIKNDALVGFGKLSQDVISIREMVQVVDSLTNGEALFERLDNSLQFSNCSAIIPNKWRTFDDERVKEIRLGNQTFNRQDILLGGINFSTSVMHEHSTEVGAYIYRLICSNGMMSGDQVFKHSRNNTSVPFIDWFREHVLAAMEALDDEFEKITRLRGQLIPAAHRTDILSNIFKEYSLSDKVQAQVMQNLMEQPPDNMYDVVQAITATANSDEVMNGSAQMIRRLQKVGGDIVARVNFCGTCFNVKR